ncbi:Biodegradative arginine decarboxylase [Yersinia aldovae ATCC 35236]|uniref:Biodegradative arginine decarboxylase n=1 Tax=Yersinia aldovae TaxID=29483 RepID=A0A0T9TFT3_YERAL|nr:Biodegradative arginine decarboxylase [Yersinia aldovae ATCC 35236]CNJ22938.1 biodegradative arginine decarboxylase [Yersinia aldovae]CNK80104.1 biodegradative arginine decarboxylase [Yersinia aldovae]
MRGNPADHDSRGPTVFATQSTHKLLAALSQASYIPVINGKKPIEHSRFNESYMLQSTTSPLYAIIAAMMEGDQGGAVSYLGIETVGWNRTMITAMAVGDIFLESIVPLPFLGI